MGALAETRKRGAEYSISDHRSPFQNSFGSPIAKKLRFSVKPLPSFNSTAVKISRYPDLKNPLPRKVHAPCGNQKFVVFGRPFQVPKLKFSVHTEKRREMGNFFSYNRPKTERKGAFGTVRDVKKFKEVIDVDDESRDDVIVVDEDRVIEDEIGTGGSPTACVDTQEGDVDMEEAKDLRPSTSSGVSDSKGAVGTNMAVPYLSKPETIDVSSVEVYRKLMEEVHKRDFKLEDLDFQIRLNETQREFQRDSRPVKKPEETPVEQGPIEPFIPLADEEEAEVESAFSGPKRGKVLVTHKNSGIDITGQMLRCLRPREWLNDEIINVYLELLKERETREPKKFKKCHFFNTFFYKKLVAGGNYNYRAVKRWTREKALGYQLIDCEKIFVPIHKEIHWCLAVINIKDQQFQYLDSLKGMDSRVLDALAKYFVEEVKDKSGKTIDVSSWEREIVTDLPAQENGYDCGMFMLKYIDFYSRGLGLCFGQEHMSYFRTRTAKEILRLRAD